MGQKFDEVSPNLERAIVQAPVYFVATASLSFTGHVNVSPKGVDTLRVLSPRTIAYLDLTGSGNETAAQITENGRLALMVCAFTGKPPDHFSGEFPCSRHPVSTQRRKTTVNLSLTSLRKSEALLHGTSVYPTRSRRGGLSTAA